MGRFKHRRSTWNDSSECIFQEVSSCSLEEVQRCSRWKKKSSTAKKNSGQWLSSVETVALDRVKRKSVWRGPRVSRFLGGATVSLICRTLAGIYFHSNNTENPKTILFVNGKKKKTANFWNYSTMSAIISFDGNQNTLLSERDVFKISLFV